MTMKDGMLYLDITAWKVQFSVDFLAPDWKKSAYTVMPDVTDYSVGRGDPYPDVIKFAVNSYSEPAGHYIPQGSYFPEQIGIYNCPEVYAVHVAQCADFPWDEWPVNDLAHVHNYFDGGGVICFSHGTNVFETPEKLSYIFIHEYCHILRGIPEDWKVGDDFHDNQWAALMHKFGLAAYKYAQCVYK